MLELGAQIGAWRTAHNLTQGELAQRAGVSLQMISSYESGDSLPNFPALQRVARPLGLAPLDLLSTMPPVDGDAEGPVMDPAAVNCTPAVRGVPFVEQFSADSLPMPEVGWWPLVGWLVPASGCIVTRVPDQAMRPSLYRGDAVLVDLRRPRKVQSGDLVLIEIGRTILFRRYLALASGDLFAAADPAHENVHAGPGVYIVGTVAGLVERVLGNTGFDDSV